MIQKATAVLISVALVALVGCGHPERVHPDEFRAQLPPVSHLRYDGPTPEVSVAPTTLGRTITVQMTVPTGGHRLTLDEVDVIEGEAMLFLTLMRPRLGEPVTMALETPSVMHETDRRFDTVQVYVREYRRGEQPPVAYQLAREKFVERHR